MRYILVAAASVVALVIVGAAFLLWPASEKVRAQPKPVPVRYLPNAALEAQLAPVAARFAGPNALQIPEGFRCYSSESQRFRRVVIVCVQ